MNELNNEFKWSFPLSGNGIETTGFDLFESYDFSGIESVVREAVQNSIDAHDEETNEPVKMKFRFFKQNASLIPGFDELKIRAKKIEQFHDEEALNNRDKAENFATLFDEEEFLCLEISDENTTGITDGPDWRNYKDGMGLSTKQGKAGSKGLGKAAFYLYSKLRLVFVETYNGSSWHSLGKASFPSGFDINDNSVITHGQGVLTLDGDDDLEHSIDFLNINKKDDRLNKKGTSLYLIDVNADNEEEEHRKIIEELLKSYLYAIWKEKLIVSVETIDNKIFLLNSKNLDNLIMVYGTEDIVDQFECIKNGTQYKITFGDKFPFADKDDEAIFYYLSNVKEASSNKGKRINIRYPGMLINKESINKQIANGSLGVLVIGDGKINKLFTAAEDSTHTKWSAQFISNRKDRANFKRVSNYINYEISNIIDEIESKNVLESTELYGSSEYLEGVEDKKSQKYKMDKNSHVESHWIKNTSKTVDISVQDEDEVDSNVVSPELGQLEEDQDGEFLHPTENPCNTHGGENKPGSGTSDAISGDDLVYKKDITKQSNLRYYSDKNNNGVEYGIAFKDYNNVGSKYCVKITFKDFDNKSLKPNISNIYLTKNGVDSAVNYEISKNNKVNIYFDYTENSNDYLFLKIFTNDKFETKAEVEVRVE